MFVRNFVLNALFLHAFHAKMVIFPLVQGVSAANQLCQIAFLVWVLTYAMLVQILTTTIASKNDALFAIQQSLIVISVIFQIIVWHVIPDFICLALTNALIVAII